MSVTMILTDNEARAVELLRELKADRGHGTLRVEVRDGLESLYRPERSELPPMRPERSGVDKR